MTIGNAIKKSFESNGKKVTYIEMIVRPPFMTSATFTISENKNKDKETTPDWYINYSYNKKGESYRRVRAGALWDKTSENGLAYKSGYIESPLFPNGKINITLFKPTQFENEPAPTTWLYDVIYKVPKKEVKVNTYKDGEYQSTTNYEPTEADLNEDVPF